MKLLLEWGADPHIKDNDGCSSMAYAQHNNLKYMLGLLKVGAACNHVCTLAGHHFSCTPHFEELKCFFHRYMARHHLETK